MPEFKKVFIIDAVRTPVGSFLGSLSSIPATELGSIVLESLLQRNNLSGDSVDEVIMGNVVQAGEGQAPARQAALGAGLPNDVECMTINKVCGSGLKSVMLAAQAIMLGDADIVLAGGMENMSQIPHYLINSRNGYKMGDQKIVDGMIKDGLFDVYNSVHMGNIAEICAKEYEISREDQDNFSIESYRRANNAIEKNLFSNEIVPVEIPQRKGDPLIVSVDEEPGKVNYEKLKALKPVFQKDGTITAANASTLNDGASALLLVSEEKVRELKLKPMAQLFAQASASKDPKWFTTAPVDAINKVLKKAGLNLGDIDLFEINEAFAVVSLVVNKLLGLDNSKVNINGGAVAIGHPIGASGARILTTLLHNMVRENKGLGLASLCIGGGEASAVIVKR